MLSLPDFKHKQILFINTRSGEGAVNICIKNENICYKKDEKIINQASCHRLFAVFILGDLTITSKFLDKAKKLGVSVFLMKQNFSVYASVVSMAEGNYALRMKQYQETIEYQLEYAKWIVQQKIENQSRLLLAKHASEEEVKSNLKKVKKRYLSKFKMSKIQKNY